METQFKTVLQKDLEIGHIYYDCPELTHGTRFKFIKAEGDVLLFELLDKDKNYQPREEDGLFDFYGGGEKYEWYEIIEQ